MEIEYSSDLFDEDRIARMAGHLRTLLEAVMAEPEQLLAELPLLTALERQQMLFEWGMGQANEEIYS